MRNTPENRIERIVTDLLHGRRLRLRAGDAEEKEAITAAAQFAAASQGPQRMSPAFRRRLAQILESTPKETWLTRRAALVAGLGVATGALAGGIVGRAQGKLVTAGAVRAFVFRQGEGVTAVSNMCSHLPCELWWDRGPKVLQCPCHPVSFFPDGKPTSPTYPLPSLNEVQARVSPEGRVEVLGT